MLDERALHLERAHKVARGVDHVVGAAHEPEIAVLVHSRAVAGDVPALAEARVVHLGVVPVRVEHRGPAGAHHEVAVHAGRHGVEVLVHDAHLHAGNGPAHRSGANFHLRVVGDQNRAGLRLPPVVVERHADGLLAPDNGLGVERLADATGVPESGQVVAARQLLPRPHQHPYGRRGGVPHRHLVLLDHLVPCAGPEAALVDELGESVGPGREHPVGSAGHPAGVGGAPVHVVLVQVERPLPGGVLLHHGLVPVNRALGLAGGARGVVHHRVVVLARLHGVEVGRGLAHLLVPVQVGQVPALGVAVVLVHYDDVLELEQLGDDTGYSAAQLRLGDEHLGSAVLQPVPDGVGAEGGEERPHNGAGLEYAEEGYVGLGQPVHEQKDAVARFDAEALDNVGEPVGESLELSEGVVLPFAVLALPNHGDFVAARAVGVAVYRLVGLVQIAAGQPVELGVHLLPVEAGARFGVLEVGRDAHLVAARLVNGGKGRGGHGVSSISL